MESFELNVEENRANMKREEGHSMAVGKDGGLLVITFVCYETSSASEFVNGADIKFCPHCSDLVSHLWMKEDYDEGE